MHPPQAPPGGPPRPSSYAPVDPSYPAHLHPTAHDAQHTLRQFMSMPVASQQVRGMDAVDDFMQPVKFLSPNRSQTGVSIDDTLRGEAQQQQQQRKPAPTWYRDAPKALADEPTDVYGKPVRHDVPLPRMPSAATSASSDGYNDYMRRVDAAVDAVSGIPVKVSQHGGITARRADLDNTMAEWGLDKPPNGLPHRSGSRSGGGSMASATGSGGTNAQHPSFSPRQRGEHSVVRADSTSTHSSYAPDGAVSQYGLPMGPPGARLYPSAHARSVRGEDEPSDAIDASRLHSTHVPAPPSTTPANPPMQSPVLGVAAEPTPGDRSLDLIKHIDEITRRSAHVLSGSDHTAPPPSDLNQTRSSAAPLAPHPTFDGPHPAARGSQAPHAHVSHPHPRALESVGAPLVRGISGWMSEPPARENSPPLSAASAPVSVTSAGRPAAPQSVMAIPQSSSAAVRFSAPPPVDTIANPRSNATSVGGAPLPPQLLPDRQDLQRREVDRARAEEEDAWRHLRNLTSTAQQKLESLAGRADAMLHDAGVQQRPASPGDVHTGYPSHQHAAHNAAPHPQQEQPRDDVRDMVAAIKGAVASFENSLANMQHVQNPAAAVAHPAPTPLLPPQPRVAAPQQQHVQLQQQARLPALSASPLRSADGRAGGVLRRYPEEDPHGMPNMDTWLGKMAREVRKADAFRPDAHAHATRSPRSRSPRYGPHAHSSHPRSASYGEAPAPQQHDAHAHPRDSRGGYVSHGPRSFPSSPAGSPRRLRSGDVDGALAAPSSLAAIEAVLRGKIQNGEVDVADLVRRLQAPHQDARRGTQPQPHPPRSVPLSYELSSSRPAEERYPVGPPPATSAHPRRSTSDRRRKGSGRSQRAVREMKDALDAHCQRASALVHASRPGDPYYSAPGTLPSGRAEMAPVDPSALARVRRR